MISVIIPTYNEEKNVSELHQQLSAITGSLSEYEFEFIFVDDCSQDKTPDILQEIRKVDARMNYIRFSRNCGSHAALAAGLNLCNGDAAIMIAADLQDPPGIIPRLLNEWKKGFKVVWGVREKREGQRFIMLACSRIFYFLMNRLTDVSQPPTGADVFLIDRDVIKVYKHSPEKNTSVYMLIAWLGFSQTAIKYTKEARHAGASKWTTTKKLKLFLDSLISFSYIPLRFMSLMGTICAFIGMLYSIVVFVDALKGIPIQGWASLMIVVLFVGGLQMLMLGMLGEYLWRTYDETRGRPRYVIEKNTLIDRTSNYSENRRASHASRNRPNCIVEKNAGKEQVDDQKS